MTNSKNSISNPYENKDVAELQILASQEIQKGNYDEANKIMAAIQSKNKTPTNKIDEFSDTQNQKREEIKELTKDINTENNPDKKNSLIEKKENLLKSFFTTDLTKRTSDIKTNLDEREVYKNKQIQDLQSQLNETFTTMPRLSEYLSLKRRRLVTINDTLQKFKTQDQANYPKNFLIYAMAISNRSLFGVRQKLKRNWIKLTRRRKSEEIGENLKTLEDKLNISTDDNKKPRTKWIKLILQKELLEAKKAYIDKQKANIWLAA